jgi:hypothetical protein
MGDLLGYRNCRSKVAFQKLLSTDIIIVFLKLFIIVNLDIFNEKNMRGDFLVPGISHV